VQEVEFQRVADAGIYVVKFFASVHSTRVFVQEVEFQCVADAGIYVVKFFARVHSTRVVCRRESSHAY
jgi:hypothetical protein